MYQWDQQRTTLDVPASRVLLLERSLSDFEVTLPGLSPELSRAYLCAYQAQKGARVAVVLQLLKSRCFAYYMNSGGEVASEQLGRVLDEGRQFAETLGFLLGDMDFRQMSPEDKQETWKQLSFLHPSLPETRNEPPKSIGTRSVPQAATPPATPQKQDPLPTAEQMMQRRRQFIENLGRLLAML